MADPDAALAAAHAEYEAAMESSAQTESDSSDTDDNDGENSSIQKARRRRRKPHPGYFFPQLSQQRMVYCLDVLKREDIKSVSGARCSSILLRRKRCDSDSSSCSEGSACFRCGHALPQRRRARQAGQHRESALYLNWTIRSNS